MKIIDNCLRLDLISEGAQLATILTSTLTALTFVFFIAAIWMALWAWRTFSISIFAWMVVGRITFYAAAFCTMIRDPDKLKSAILTLQAQSTMSPSDFIISATYLTTLFPSLATLGFCLVALGEISHVGPLIAPNYKPQRRLLYLYRLRHVFGVFAVTCGMVPSIAIYIWYRSIT